MLFFFSLPFSSSFVPRIKNLPRYCPVVHDWFTCAFSREGVSKKDVDELNFLKLGLNLKPTREENVHYNVCIKSASQKMFRTLHQIFHLTKCFLLSSVLKLDHTVFLITKAIPLQRKIWKIFPFMNCFNLLYHKNNRLKKNISPNSTDQCPRVCCPRSFVPIIYYFE